jgi:3-oxoadipate enol-lactonase
MLIETNGIQTNYEFSGRADAPVVVLSHSLGSSLEMWNPQIELLSNHFQVLRYDTRGHGGSDVPPEGYSLEDMAQDAIGLMDALKIDTVYWVGLSMGGMIGQALALNHTDRIQRLALCDTAAVIPDEAQPIWQERIDAAEQDGLQALVEGTLERWFTPTYYENNPPEVEHIRKLFLSTPLAGYLGCSEAIRKLNYLGQLSEINIPTLIIIGEEDFGTPVEAAEAMHARIAGSKLVILPSAAHLSNIQQAGRFNEALLGFLQGN